MRALLDKLFRDRERSIRNGLARWLVVRHRARAWRIPGLRADLRDKMGAEPRRRRQAWWRLARLPFSMRCSANF